MTRTCESGRDALSKKCHELSLVHQDHTEGFKIARSAKRPLKPGLDQNERNAVLNRRRREFEQALQLNRRDLPQWIRYAELEIEAGQLASARSIYERALAVDYTYVPLWYRYAQSEAKARNFAAARAVLQRALKLLPLESKLYLTLLEFEEICGDIEYCKQIFEQWHATGSNDVYVPWLHFSRRHWPEKVAELERHVQPAQTEERDENGGDIELWWLSLNSEPALFEQAVVACKPRTEFKDTRWRMYALLWLRYAIHTELQGSGSAESIYERALSQYKHAKISSATLWTNYAMFLVRQGRSLQECRKLFGSALGKTWANAQTNPKILREYAKFEARLGDLVRVRKLLGMLCANWPQLASSWLTYARFEAGMGEIERSAGIYELAVELNDDISVWTAYLDFAADNLGIAQARAVAQRSLAGHHAWHPQMVAEVAIFELGLGMDTESATPDVEAVESARGIFEQYAFTSREVYDLYIQFEKAYGDNDSLERLRMRDTYDLQEEVASEVSSGNENEVDSEDESVEVIEEKDEKLSGDKSSAESDIMSDAESTEPVAESVVARLLANAQKWKMRND